MATTPIDLSAGLVPKQGGIDLSAGLVKKSAPLTAPQQKAFDSGYAEQSDPIAAAKKQLTPDWNTVTDFGSDVGSTIKGLGHTLLDPPKDSSLTSALTDNPLVRMSKGYFDSVQASKAAATDAHVHGESGREAVETAATALPLVGPLLHDVYGKSGGVGASRILQVASMSPGDVIPNPISEAIKPIARAVKNARTVDPQAAMQSVLPKPTGGNAITDVVSPKLVENVRKAAARSGKTAQDFSGAKGAENFSNAVDETSKAIDSAYNSYLQPVADIPHPLPNISEPVLAKIVDAIEINNKPAAQRIRSGQTTVADSDLVRRTINQMTESSFNSAKTYEPAMIQGLNDAGSAVRDSLYSKLEALHNLPENALADLKRQQGEVLQVQPLANKLNASVQTAAARDATRTIPQKIGSAYSKIKSLGSATELASRQAQGLGLVDDSSRLLKHVFSDLPTDTRTVGSEFPPPSTITKRSTFGPPAEIVRAIQPASVELGGPQDITGPGSRSAPQPLYAPDVAAQPAMMRVPPAPGVSARPVPQGGAQITPLEVSGNSPHPFLPEGMTQNTAELPAFLQEAINSGKVPAGKPALRRPAAKIDMVEHTGGQADAMIPQPSQIVTMHDGTRVRVTHVDPQGFIEGDVVGKRK